MKKKEYKKIVSDIKAKKFPHTYKAIDDKDVHEEQVMVIELQDLLEILSKYLKNNLSEFRVIIARFIGTEH